jgi:ABC-type antimicrobial peptide transport system permease subunit
MIGADFGSRVLQSLLYEVKPGDPLALLGASMLLLVVVVFAILLPARWASSMDPVNALRSE